MSDAVIPAQAGIQSGDARQQAMRFSASRCGDGYADGMSGIERTA